MGHIVALFDEAWEHRRRRRRHAVIVVLCVATVVAVYGLLVHGGGQGTGAGSPPQAGPVAVSPSRVLARPLYMGVAGCRLSNPSRCDRVGLAVWLRTRAASVTATIAGAPLTLNRGGDLSAITHQPRREFVGYLQPAGFVSRMHVRCHGYSERTIRHGRTRVVPSSLMCWQVGHHPSPVVRLVIRHRSGRTVTTHLRVALSNGWG